MSRPKHALKGAVHRRLYALVLTAEHGWVRFFHFGRNDELMVDLDGQVVDGNAFDTLSTRLVRAVVEELREDDPFVRIAVGDTVVRLDWSDEYAMRTPLDDESHTDE